MSASVWQSIDISSLTALSFLLLSDSLEQPGKVDDDINHLSSRRPWLWAWLNGGQSVHSTDKFMEHLLCFRIWARPLLSWSLQCSLETTHKQVNTKVRIFHNVNCYKGKQVLFKLGGPRWQLNFVWICRGIRLESGARRLISECFFLKLKVDLEVSL